MGIVFLITDLRFISKIKNTAKRAINFICFADICSFYIFSTTIACYNLHLSYTDMKLAIATISIAFMLAGCSKSNNVKPNVSAVTAPSVLTASVTTVNNTSPLNHDDSLHMVIFNLKNQIVNSAVAGSTLTLTLNENIDIYVTKTGYAQTSSVHLLESLNHSLLAGFDFTTVNEEGQTTLNWVDDNLNNVTKTVTDTTINNTSFVKISVKRPFTFFKTYNTSTDAIAYQSYLLADTSDIITFSSYCYYNQKVYETSSTVGHVVYTK